MDGAPDRAERSRIVTWGDPKANAAAGRTMAGIDHLRAMMRGDLPAPPIMALMGIELVSVEPGAVAMAIDPGEHLYNPIGSVHGGVAATILDSVMACSIHSLLPLGRAYTTLEIKVNYIRAITDAVGRVTGEGRVIHLGGKTAVAEGRMVDAAGKVYASGTTTCLVFDLPAPRP